VRGTSLPDVPILLRQGDHDLSTAMARARHEVALAPRGRLFVVHAAGHSVQVRSGDRAVRRAISRFNGTLDPSFSGDGKVTTTFTSGSGGINAVAIRPNGKVVAVGFAGGGACCRFAVARYRADGTLDPAFSGDGKVTTDFTVDFEYAYGVAIRANGKIVAVGSAAEGSPRSRFALARYIGDGTPDPTFGSSGKVITPFASGFDYTMHTRSPSRPTEGSWPRVKQAAPAAGSHWPAILPPEGEPTCSAQSFADMGNGRATGSGINRLRPSASKRSRPRSVTSITSVRPVRARSAARRATAGPHIMP
jgi:uncharacterized delta-60 repeat protein